MAKNQPAPKTPKPGNGQNDELRSKAALAAFGVLLNHAMVQMGKDNKPIDGPQLGRNCWKFADTLVATAREEEVSFDHVGDDVDSGIDLATAGQDEPPIGRQ